MERAVPTPIWNVLFQTTFNEKGRQLLKLVLTRNKEGLQLERKLNIPPRTTSLTVQTVGRHRVVVKPFPGATIRDMKSHIVPTIERSPDQICLHVGTNDLTDLPRRMTSRMLLST